MEKITNNIRVSPEILEDFHRLAKDKVKVDEVGKKWREDMEKWSEDMDRFFAHITKEIEHGKHSGDCNGDTADNSGDRVAA